MTRTSGHLFDEAELAAWLQERHGECKAELARLPEARLLEEPIDQMAQSFLNRYRVEPIELHVDRKYAVDRGEIEIWGSGGLATDRVRVRVGGRSGPPGRAIAVHVPFTGDPELLFLRPGTHTFSGPQGHVENSELVFPFESPSEDTLNVEVEATSALSKIEDPYLQSQAEDLGRFNDELSGFITESLGSRLQRVLKAREQLDGLRIPVYRRGDAPKTYAAPGIERRPAPQAPQAKAHAAAPITPVLVEDFYRHIIDVIGAMARGMERTPGDYATWPEEKLRDVILVILNTHYKGQATGETFNKSGRTDVIVRIEDRNVFVDECKWWRGASSFAGTGGDEPSALDQLLGYTTWRDAKLALTVFVGRKDIGKVIESARETLEAHPAFVRWAEGGDEGQLRCCVRLPEDDGRSADLAIIFVHLPKD
jgi:hypothetical protein